MKPSILIIHNKYLFKGGEDVVVANETETLRKSGYPLHMLFFDNTQAKGIRGLFFLHRIYFNLSSFLKVYRFVKKNRIQFVHVHNLFYNASPSVLWAAKAAGAKTIMTLHNYRLFCLNALFFRDGKTCTLCADANNFSYGIQFSCFKNKTFSRLLASALEFHWRIGSWEKKTDRFVVINPLMEQFLLQKGIRQEKIFLKPNFLPLHKSYPRANREEYYFFAGRLEKEKGIEHLLAAFRLNKKRIIIAGEGHFQPLVQQYANDHITFAGQQTSDQIMHHLRYCKALIFPSVCLEGSPIILIEALSNGTPIIAGESVTTKNILSGITGKYLYETGNASALNEAISNFEMATDEDVRSIEQKNKQLYADRFSEMSYLQAAEQIYS